MVRFLKKIWIKWLLKRCQILNNRAGGEAYIVIEITGKYYVVNRKRYRYLRRKGVFKTCLNWSEAYKNRITD